MHALWVSLEENFNCGVKLTGVVRPPGTCYKKRSPTTEKDKLESELVHSTKVICKQNSTRTLLSSKCLLSHNAFKALNLYILSQDGVL